MPGAHNMGNGPRKPLDGRFIVAGLIVMLLALAVYGCVSARRAEPQCRVVTDTENLVEVPPGECIDIPVPVDPVKPSDLT